MDQKLKDILVMQQLENVAKLLNGKLSQSICITKNQQYKKIVIEYDQLRR